MDVHILSFIQDNLFGWPAEVLSIVTFIVASVFLLLFLKYGGAAGVFCFINIAYISANIHVLHVAQFSFLKEPVALGTVMFAMTYLATDILVEHYGPRKARLSVLLSFMTQVAFTLIMLAPLAYPPIDGQPFLHGHIKRPGIYEAMSLIFLPAVRTMIASITAYFSSQLLDIGMYKALSRITHKKYVWLRASVAPLVSALVDNIIFSVLAWYILSPTPVHVETLIYTYILGTYIARAFVAVAGVPVMYLSYYFKPKKDLLYESNSA